MTQEEQNSVNSLKPTRYQEARIDNGSYLPKSTVFKSQPGSGYIREKQDYLISS